MQTSAKLGKNDRLLQGVGSKHAPGPQSLGGLAASMNRYLPKTQSKDLVGSGVFVGALAVVQNALAHKTFRFFNGKWLLQ